MSRIGGRRPPDSARALTGRRSTPGAGPIGARTRTDIGPHSLDPGGAQRIDLAVGILFTGYAMLDGFDLGIGALHLFTKTDEERRLMINAIGPIWDGNEVWLVVGGGVLFAAFPNVYATVFSGFYLAFILLLVALIFRAVAIEFRSKQPMGWWRQMWDVGFSAGSLASICCQGPSGKWQPITGTESSGAGQIRTINIPPLTGQVFWSRSGQSCRQCLSGLPVRRAFWRTAPGPGSRPGARRPGR